MNLRHALLYTAAVVAVGSSATSAQAATSVSATFTKGAVAEYDRNPNQTDNAKLFSELGIASITISQASGSWGGTQGNDTNVSVTLTLTNGQTRTFAAAINWLQKTGSTADWVGLTIDPTTTVNDGFTLSDGFAKTYILEFAHSTLVETLYAGGTAPGALDGSADTNGALNALNALVPADNTAPVITGPTGGAGAAASAVTVNENQTGATRLTSNEAVTWSIIGGTEAAKFDIAADGTITFKAAPDYEAPTDTDTNNSYVLLVQATDASGNTSTQAVTVNVANLNDVAPVFTNTNATGGAGGAASYSFNYAENSATGATLGTVSASGTGTLAYSITAGNDSGWYAINPATGAITLTAAGAISLANDFEQTANTQSLTVQVSNGTLNTTILVALNETNVDDTAPIITGPSGGAGAAASSITVNENQTAVTRPTANEGVTWAITGGADAGKFNIAPDGTITFKTAPDYESPTDADGNNAYILIVEATDPAGNKSVQTITVNVADVNDNAPVFTNTNANGGSGGAASYSFNYAENSAIGATLGTVSASGVGTLAYSITGGNANGWYAINAATGAITLTAAGAISLANDFEQLANSQALTVQVSNGTLSTTILVALNETNVDDTAPVITGPSGGAGAAASTITVNENQTAVTRPTANESVTWAITGGTDAGKFNIAPDGTITFKTAPDYEAPTDSDTNNSYVLIVEATDAAGNKSVQTITVNVADVNDNAPVFTNTNANGGSGGAASYSFNYAENSATGATLGTVSASGVGTLAYSITAGNDSGWYAINAATGAITLTAAGAASVANDFEQMANTKTLSVQVSNGTLSSTILVALNETDVDDAPPAITGPSGGAAAAASAITVNEGQTGVTKLTASEGVTWAIIGGTELSKFTIAPDGTITFKASPDYEAPTDGDTNNTYVLTVEATDPAGNKSVQTITVTVANVNDTAPVFTNTNANGGAAGAASYNFNHVENSAAGATLGNVSATGAAALTYTIVGGNANGWYALDPVTGVITLTADGAASIANDFERTTNSQTLTVQVSDGPQSTTITVALNETDVDDAAPLITAPNGSAGAAAAAITVNEGQTAVAKLTASEGVTWAITGGTELSRFSIAADGTITFKAAPDYEAPTDGDTNNTYVLIVEATDPAGNKSVQTMTVTVADIDDTAPVIAGPNGANGTAAAAITVNENQTAVTRLVANEAVTWSLLDSGDAGKFTIAPDGTITFKAAPDYETPTDGDTNNTYVLTVQAVDAQGNKSVQTITVTVANVDDSAPLITGPSGGAGAANSAISVYENQTAVTRVTANETVTWAVAGGADAARFALAADGTITFLAAPDFENPTDADRNNTYVIQVRATDATGNTSVQTVTVTVMNLDEIMAKLNAISDKLRGDLRNYAFGSLQDMLSFNEGMMQNASDPDCAAPTRGKGLHGSAKANESGQAVDLKMSRQVNACAARIRVFFDMGLSASSMQGNSTLRGLGSVRFETLVRKDVTLGVGLLGSFAADDLASFASSSISDQSLQGNLYVRARLSDSLRAGAFGSIGKAWYRFGLHDDGFHLAGRMTGDRHAYGAMLSGDLKLGGMKVTTDVALSRAVEKLDNADLSASYKGESRSGIAFMVGTVDATRLSVPAHMRLIDRGGENKVSGRALSLVFSPGLLCEDRTADASSLTCGFQLGGKLLLATSHRDKAYFDARHEDISGNKRDIFSIGYAHTWGPMELGLSVDRAMSSFMGDSRAMVRLRFVGL